MEVIRGCFKRSLFEAPEKSFCVYLYKYLGKDAWFTVVGAEVPSIASLYIDLHGEWRTNKKTGKKEFAYQYHSIPTDGGKKALLAYFSSLKCGIGVIKSALIYKKFGDEIWDILSHNERLPELKGIISEKNLQKLKEALDDNDASRALFELTATTGLPLNPTQIKRITKKFGRNAAEIVKNKPYRLCNVEGIGFDTADSVAMSEGYALDDKYRLLAAVDKVHGMNAARGNTCMTVETALKGLEYVLHTADADLCRRALKQSTGRGDTKIRGGLLLDISKDKVEENIARKLLELLSACEPSKADIDALISDYETKNHVTLAPQQKDAVRAVFRSGVAVVTGGPGTGKTTVIKGILSVHRAVYGEFSRPLLLAPTGRASRRMADATGYEAQTIHSAVHWKGEENDEAIEGADETFDNNLIIVDEASMMDQFITGVLIRKVKRGCRLVFVGDPDQLPSVGCGNVLNDMIRSQVIPTVRLKVIFRQAKESPIVANAYAINHGQVQLRLTEKFSMYEEGTELDQFKKACRLYLACVKRFGNMDDVILLNPQRNNTSLSVDAFNKELQHALNPPSKTKAEIQMASGQVFRVGDRVMQLKNRDVAKNGDVGYITAIYDFADPEDTSQTEKRIEIDFMGELVQYSLEDMKDVDLAYCATVHKVQGEEYKAIIIVMSESHPSMLKRNMLYTAVTRAKDVVMVVGQMSAVRKAIENVSSNQRMTLLADRLHAYATEEVKTA